MVTSGYMPDANGADRGAQLGQDGGAFARAKVSLRSLMPKKGLLIRRHAAIRGHRGRWQVQLVRRLQLVYDRRGPPWHSQVR